MSRYWFFAFSDCKDPTRSQEYNKWYGDAHILDMLEVPGMIQATLHRQFPARKQPFCDSFLVSLWHAKTAHADCDIGSSWSWEEYCCRSDLERAQASDLLSGPD